MSYYLGVDLGGTNIAAGLLDDEANIIAKDSARTNPPRSPEAVCDDIARLCAGLLEGAGLKSADIPWIGVGSPGTIYNNRIVYANNLDFRDAPLAEIVCEKTGIPTFLENDANSAALGEWAYGAGRGKSSLVFIGLGTGVGGGIVSEGRILGGFSGAGAEIGHIVIIPGGRRCTCGKRGCFEAYCSATALKAITKEAMERCKESLMWGLCGGESAAVSAKTCFQAQRAGDKAGAQVVEEYLYNLSLGIDIIVNLLQPEVICIGGGVSNEGDAILVPLRELAARHSPSLLDVQRPQILASKLGTQSGLVGAAFLGKWK